jgi:penicillin-binding protein 2
MTNELDCLRQLRPDVPPPCPQTRRAALQRLQAAIASESNAPDAPAHQAGLRGQSNGAASSPGGAPVGAELDVQPASGAAIRHWRRPNLGLAVLVIATVAALVIAGGAIVLLGHRRAHPTSATHGPGMRGQIVDRTGLVLAVDHEVTDVEIRPAALADSSAIRGTVYQRLARVLRISTVPQRCRLPSRGVTWLAAIPCAVARQQAVRSAANVTVAKAVSPRVISQLAGHPGQFPGIVTSRVSVRSHPLGELAAQVLGTAGLATATQAATKNDSASAPGPIAGQSGLEAYYNSALGAGDTLKLALDTRLQQAGQQALQRAINTNPPADGGAFVAMNPQNGAVYAIGSLPSYDPNVLAGNLSQSTYRKLTNPVNGDPLLDRATQSAGPLGSTFQIITATAALQSGAWSPDETYDDTGQFCIDGQCRHNSGSAAYGVVNLPSAIRVSDNDFFYNLGALTNTSHPNTEPNGGPLDQWAQVFGIGHKTGIDLPGEASGTLPTPQWRAQRNRLEAQCDNATGPFQGKPKHPAGGCGIADGTNSPWSVGDNINLAAGQGDIQVTPIQLAVAYSAVANDGTIVRPHIAADIQYPNGTILQTIGPPPIRHLNINPIYLQTIQAGLRAAASQNGGTSDEVFDNFPEQVYGQAGTAQYINTTGAEQDYAWYAGFVPATATNKPITVVVTVDKGGYGAHAAAPVARQIISQWLLGRPGPWQPGKSHTL